MSSISVDYDVLNQKGSPAWYSDTFANIPTPGYKGRMFISIDTFAFYRDNGTGWDLVGGPGTGTITGAGVFGQVTFFSGTDTISGNTDFVWDNTNKRLGINTGTPGAPLDIHSTGTAAQFNGTTTNNAFVLFQNAGTSKWRIGNLYNSGANDYQIYDVLNATARLTIKNTGASTLIGTFTATSLIKSGGTSSQILLADGTTTPTSTFGAGSVTNVSAITLGTSGTDLSSSVANSTTTPVITLNVPTASATNRGALSSADWTTFNNKQATLSLTTTGTSGAATLVGATLNIPNYTNVGTVTSVSALTLGTTGTDLSSTVANSTSTPVITLNVPTASATNRGALSSADFTTFNNKQATISVTAPVVLTGATISMPAATTSVNGYLTSTDWNTFNNKSNTNGTVTSVVALTIGTSGIDITSTAVTTTTTPVITLNIPTASASNRGALSSTDWTTFNNKQATLSLTTTGTSGVATLVANTLNVPNYGSALSGYLPLSAGASYPLTGDLYLSATDGRILGGTTTGRAVIGNSNLSTYSIWYGATNATPNITTFVNNSALTLTLNANNTATFSSSVTTGGNVIIPTTYGFNNNIYYSGGYKYLDNGYGFNFLNDGSGNVIINQFANNTSGAGAAATALPRLTIASTGAATFSIASGVYTAINITSPNTSVYYKLTPTGGDSYILGSGVAQTDDFCILNDTRSTNYLKFIGGASGGAATFSSSVTATNDLTINAALTPIVFLNTTSTNKASGFVTQESGTNKWSIGSNFGSADGTFNLYNYSAAARYLIIATTGAATFSSDLRADGTDFRFGGNFNPTAEPGRTALNINGSSNSLLSFTVAGTLKGYVYHNGTNLNLWNSVSGAVFIATDNTTRYTITSAGINNYTSRGNYLGATDNALFSLNSGGTLYTVGFSPTATASSTNTLTLTTGTTTWIYTGTGTATWTLPNPSGNNQIYWIKNAGTGIITLNAYSGTNIINNAAASVSSITIAVGATAVIAQDGNVKSYQLQ